MSANEMSSILVVDDDTDIRETLVDILQDNGYEAIPAMHGLDALSRLRDGGLRPSMILLDLMMPVMDGQAFRVEQQKDPALADIPVVVISAYHEVEKTARAMGTRLIRKPIDLEELLVVIDEICRGTAPQPKKPDELSNAPS